MLIRINKVHSKEYVGGYVVSSGKGWFITKICYKPLAPFGAGEKKRWIRV